MDAEFYLHKNVAVYVYLLQIIAVYNAIMLGWQVKKIGQQKYELSKNITELQDFDFKYFMKNIISTQPF
jgi:ABC-type uncharacterized transport system permease subunit